MKVRGISYKSVICKDLIYFKVEFSNFHSKFKNLEKKIICRIYCKLSIRKHFCHTFWICRDDAIGHRHSTFKAVEPQTSQCPIGLGCSVRSELSSSPDSIYKQVGPPTIFV